LRLARKSGYSDPVEVAVGQSSMKSICPESSGRVRRNQRPNAAPPRPRAYLHSRGRFLTWSHPGRQAVLNLRSCARSERFDQAWALLAATFTAEATVIAYGNKDVRATTSRLGKSPNEFTARKTMVSVPSRSRSRTS
jgi:hypothetical protein